MEIISLWQLVHMQLNATQDTYQSTWVDCIHSRHQNVSLIEFPHQNRSGSDKYSRVFSCIDANRLQKQQQISLQYLSFLKNSCCLPVPPLAQIGMKRICLSTRWWGQYWNFLHLYQILQSTPPETFWKKDGELSPASTSPTTTTSSSPSHWFACST